MTAEPAIAALFGRDPLALSSDDIDAMVAEYRRAAANGHFRPAAHRAIAAGKPPPRRRKTAAQLELGL